MLLITIRTFSLLIKRKEKINVEMIYVVIFNIQRVDALNNSPWRRYIFQRNKIIISLCHLVHESSRVEEIEGESENLNEPT